MIHHFKNEVFISERWDKWQLERLRIFICTLVFLSKETELKNLNKNCFITYYDQHSIFHKRIEQIWNLRVVFPCFPIYQVDQVDSEGIIVIYVMILRYHSSLYKLL